MTINWYGCWMLVDDGTPFVPSPTQSFSLMFAHTDEVVFCCGFVVYYTRVCLSPLLVA